MRKSNLDEIRRMDTKSIMVKVSDMKKEIADLVLDKNTSKLKDLKSISKKRREIAQMLTVMNQKITLEKLESKEAAK